MSALEPKPDLTFVTGFQRGWIFGPAEKKRALEIAAENVERGELPKITELCKTFGICTRTWYQHLADDAAWKAAWTSLMEMAEEKLVSVMYANGQRPSGYMDRITWLRAHNPKKWNPDLKVQFSQSSSPFQKGIEVIDGEIVGKGELSDGKQALLP